MKVGLYTFSEADVFELFKFVADYEPLPLVLSTADTAELSTFALL